MHNRFKDPRILKGQQRNDQGRQFQASNRFGMAPPTSQFSSSAAPKTSSFTQDGFKIPFTKESNPPIQEAATELKINQKNQKDNKVKDLLNLKKFGQATSNELLQKRKFFDSSIENKLNKRDRRKTGAFNFVQEGQFIKRGEQLRKKQLLDEFENKQNKVEEQKDEMQDLDQRMKFDGNGEDQIKKDEGKIQIRKTVNLKPLDPIPDFEWWDIGIFAPTQDLNVTQKRVDGIVEDGDIFLDKITHYIQHPVPIKNEYVENINKMVIPIHLTDKEKKRLRKMKRLEKEKDKQEKVKLGLMPAPLPKIKLSNYMKVLGKEAIADPSRVEQQVKRIVDARLEQHLQRNESNKLTREQKEAKMKRKHERDINNNECRVALFKIDKLTEPHLKFKIDMNAKQYHLGGFCFIADYNMAPADLPNLVLIEGGPRAIKKYKRLMLRRIKWNEKSKKKHNHNNNEVDQDGDQQMEEEKNDNNAGADDDMDNIKESLDKKCFLVWEGVTKKKNFERWRIVDIRSEGEAKRLLGERGCEHYWNMVVNFIPERAEGEDPQPLEKLLM